MEEWRWYQSVEWWINIFLFSPRYIGHDTSNVRKIYRILWKGITMISIRRHDRIEKCCQRERSNYVVNSVVGFWNRRTWSGKRSERRKEKKKRRRVAGNESMEGKKKRGKRRVGVRDRRSNAATVEWMAYRWRTRPPNSIGGRGRK